MNMRFRTCLVAAIALAACAGTSLAQWTNDPSLNTRVTSDPNSQDICKVAATSDGGCWISWYNSVGAPNNYSVRIQRLNRGGVPQLGADGMLVSAFPNGTAIFGDMELRVDNGDNALLVFNDTRSTGVSGGTDLELIAYRIAPDGTMLWGANGVQLTDDTLPSNVGRIAQTTDGNYTVVFDRTNSAAANNPQRALLMQRLDAAGNLLLAAGGVIIAGAGVGGAAATDGPSFHQMVAADNNSVIVFYGKDTRLTTSQRYPTIQKYDANGVGLWNGGNAIVLQNNVWPIGSYPGLISDNAGGAVACWHDGRGGLETNYIQKFNAAGVAQFPAGGVAAATTAGRVRFSPSNPVLGPGGEVYVFWSDRDSSQGNRSLNGQRINPDGSRAWGDGGIAFTAFDTVIEDFIRATAPPACQPGAVIVFKNAPTGPSNNDTVLAIRVDGDGDPVWSPSPVTVCSTLSGKGRFPNAVLSDGAVVQVWTDNRNDSGDLYAQRINADGTLGNPAYCPADYNLSGAVSVQDIFDFLAGYFGNAPAADFNLSCSISVQDIFDFLAAYFTPCP